MAIFVVEEDRVEFAAFRGRVLETCTRQTGEFRLLQGHHPVPFLMEGTAWGDTGGNAKSLRLGVTDISARKQAEETLRERENICSAIVNQTVDGIVLTDTETLQFVEFNDAACNGLGYTRAEFAALRLPDIQAVLTPNEVSERVRALLTAGATRFENRHRCKNGEIRDRLVSHRIVRVRGRDFMAGIWMDITDRKRAEKEVAFKAALLEAQAATAREGILFVDSNGRAIPLNKRFGEMCNIPQDILDSRDDQRLLQVAMQRLQNPAEFLDKVGYLYAHQEEKSYDQLHLRDGRVFERYSSPLLGTNGEYYGRIRYFMDITESQVRRRGDQDFRGQVSPVVRDHARRFRQRRHERHYPGMQ